MLEKFLDEHTEPGAATCDEFARRYLTWCQRGINRTNVEMTIGKLRVLGMLRPDGLVKVRVKHADTR
ncbi:hypothetical protein Pan44_35380 [Caulifigura coniformis]|uniref:Uncharacterized protein n=1 Tax=Caulifigura coniformis TaxID=2527983 RepID=A0A517SH88_9PLAN|nr:hypothetical protein Pan44_35380 [Caulifigura coniformis]